MKDKWHCNRHCVTYWHSLSTMQAVDGGLRFCVAGELDEGAACVHREREKEKGGATLGRWP